MLQKPALRITAVYLIAALLWILLSDSVLYFIAGGEPTIPGLSIVKGIGFVIVTSAILYAYLQHEFERRYALEAELRTRMAQVEQSQAALEQSEQRFRKAVEELPHPTMIFSEDGKVLAVNRVWTEITGYTPEQLKTIDSWTELAYGEGKQPVKEGIDRLFDLKHRIDEGDWTIRCHDGSQRIWEFSSTPLGHLPDQGRIVLSIAHDVTQQRQAERIALENERLKARFQKEQERNALVQRIISALSHDLRTPLTVISTSREMLMHYFHRMTAEQRLEKLEAIGRQVQFVLDLLEDTVNMARGNIAEAAFRPAPVNLAALCQVSVSEVHAVQGAGHPMSFVNRSRLETVLIDEVLVSRILLNLLSNAVKYSPDASAIRLELDCQEEWIVLRVIDHGVGIGENDLPYIFDPFFRARAVVELANGTGLGLSIVKECVERHGGRIRVESALGQGSTFTVELPLEKGEQLLRAAS